MDELKRRVRRGTNTAASFFINHTGTMSREHCVGVEVFSIRVISSGVVGLNE